MSSVPYPGRYYSFTNPHHTPKKSLDANDSASSLSHPRSIFHPDYSPLNASFAPQNSISSQNNASLSPFASSLPAFPAAEFSSSNSSLPSLTAAEADQLANSSLDTLRSISDSIGPHSAAARFLIKSLDLFDNLRFSPPHDQFTSIGRPRFLRSLLSYYMEQQTIHFVLPAFPFKSPNTQFKVLGHLPDRGEELAIQRLETFCKDFTPFYSPGARLLIMSDGRVFSDLLGVSDQKVSEYEKELKRYLSNWIEWDSLDRHIGPRTDERIQWENERGGFILGDYLRDKLVRQWETQEAMQRLEREIAEDSDLARVYRGFSQFLQLDLIWPSEWSRSKIKREAFIIAKRMLVRNQSFSLLVERLFPTSIRLSIHSHSNSGPKYGVQMIPSANAEILATPWHNCVLETFEGTEMLVKRWEAEQKGAELVMKHGRPWKFREVRPDAGHRSSVVASFNFQPQAQSSDAAASEKESSAANGA